MAQVPADALGLCGSACGGARGKCLLAVHEGAGCVHHPVPGAERGEVIAFQYPGVGDLRPDGGQFTVERSGTGGDRYRGQLGDPGVYTVFPWRPEGCVGLCAWG